MSEMTERFNALTTYTDQLQARVGAHEDQTTTLTKSPKRLESRVNELAAVAKEHDKQTSALRQDVAALQRALDSARAQPGALGYSCMRVRAASHT